MRRAARKASFLQKALNTGPVWQGETGRQSFAAPGEPIEFMHVDDLFGAAAPFAQTDVLVIEVFELLGTHGLILDIVYICLTCQLAPDMRPA
jgi:hypothetical protein